MTQENVAMSLPSIAEIFDLTGKGATVTGGALGIGQGIAFRLAEAGAGVIIADVNMNAANETVEQIRKRGGKAHAVQADIGSVSDARKAVNAASEAFGSIDILVNNAGISPLPMMPALETKEEVWDKVLDVNLRGMFFASQEAAKEMIKGGKGGKIINIASEAYMYPPENMPHYSASKGGVVSLTRALAKEWATHNILVNAIAPGGILSSAAKATIASFGMDPELARQKNTPLTARIPLGKWGEPDAIAKVALFLASKAAEYMTGSTVLVDGGHVLG